jgi:hypothetical protein
LPDVARRAAAPLRSAQRSAAGAPAVGPSVIPGLVASLVARLSELDLERARIHATLAALDQRLENPPRRRRPRGAPVLLDAVGDDPGVRASVLALTLGRAFDDVRAEIEELEHSGRIRRDGLGWRRTEVHQ